MILILAAALFGVSAIVLSCLIDSPTSSKACSKQETAHESSHDGEHSESASDVESSNESVPSLALLPNELVLMILGFLPTRDRLRARVNRRFHKIEAEGHYYEKLLQIRESMEDAESCKMILDAPREEYFEGLKKLASNITFDTLWFIHDDPSDTLLFPYIKNLRVDRIDVSIWNYNEEAKAQFGDAYFEEWIVGKKSILVQGVIPLTGAKLYSVFQAMHSGQSSLVELEIDIEETGSLDFIRRMGLTRVGRRLYSTNRELKTYSYPHSGLPVKETFSAITLVVGRIIVEIGMLDEFIIFRMKRDEKGDSIAALRNRASYKRHKHYYRN